ncbi:MAG TPA: isochorismatase family protein [Streptosporangiaceae bacterium]
MTDESLDAAQTALLLIDLQVRIVGRQLAPRGGAEVVRQAMRLADTVRDKGGLVVVVQAERPGADPQPPGSELVDEIAPQPGDLLITKHTWGAFHETGLDDKLRGRGITTLVIGGIATNFGVESTARVADEFGYRIVLVEDAMAGLDAESHAFAVTKIFPLIGTVCSTDDVLTRLGHDARRPSRQG